MDYSELLIICGIEKKKKKYKSNKLSPEDG
jgi:hypothetical protein